MVKKKAPSIPVTIIVLGAGFVFAMNARSHPVDPELEQKRLQQQAAEAEHPKANPDQMTQSIKQSTQAIKPAPKTNRGGPPTASGGDNPMLSTKPPKFKPTYNPTTAETGWYRPK